MGHSRFKKFYILLAALLLLAGFVTAFLHHHEDGYHFQDCSVCQFVGSLKILALFLLVFVFRAGKIKFLAIPSFSFIPFFFDNRLKTRAPPALS